VATHDAGLAARAPRRLTIKDGHLVADNANGKKTTPKKSEASRIYGEGGQFERIGLAI